MPPMQQSIPLGDMTELSGPLSSICLPSIATATSPLDYIDGLPSDKKEGEEVLQYEQQGSGNAGKSETADSNLRGGVEVKLGQSGMPEGDKLAELDFLRQSIESYRGPHGERLQLVPIASGDGASVTLGINVTGEEAEPAAAEAAPGPSLSLSPPAPGVPSAAGAFGLDAETSEGFQGLEVPSMVPVEATGGLASGTGGASFSEAYDVNSGVLAGADISGPDVLGGSFSPGGLAPPTHQESTAAVVEDCGVQKPGVVLENPPRRRRSGGFARKRSRFGEGTKGARPVLGSMGAPFGSRELIGENENQVVVDSGGVSGQQGGLGQFITPGQVQGVNETKAGEATEGALGESGVQAAAVDEENKSLMHGMEAAFGSTESLPSAFERVLQNQALSEAQDEQGQPYPPLERTSSGGPVLGGPAGSIAPLGWAASIWRTPSPIPWPFNLPPTASPPVSPSSPRSFDSGFGHLGFLSGPHPSFQDLMRQNSLENEVLSPIWRPGSALQATLSGGFESGFTSGQGLTRQSSLEEGTVSPSWRPGSAFQPVFPSGQVPGYANLQVPSEEPDSKKKVTQVPGYYPGLPLTQESPEGSPRGRLAAGSGAGSAPNPGQVIARPKAITPQVPFTLERVLAAQQHSRVSEEVGAPQGFDMWEAGKKSGEESGRREGQRSGGQDETGSDLLRGGKKRNPERSGSVDWSRFEGSLENIRSSPSGFEATSTNPLVLPTEAWPGKQYMGSGFYNANPGYGPSYLVDGYPDAASLQQAAYEEEQRRVIQQNWPHSPPQGHVVGTRGGQGAVPALTLPQSLDTVAVGATPGASPPFGAPADITSPAANSNLPAVPTETHFAGGQPFFPGPPVRSVKSLPVSRGRKRKLGSTASDSSAEMRKASSQPALSGSSPSSGDTISQDATPPPPPPQRPKPIAPKIEARGSPFYPAGPALFQTAKPQQGFPSPLLRVRLMDLVLRDGSESESHEFAVRNLAASLQNANAAVLQLSAEDAKLVRDGLMAQRLFFEGRRPGELSRVREGSTEGYDVGGFVRRGRGVTFLHRAGRPYQDSQPPLLPDLYRLLGEVSRTVLAATARHVGLRADAFSDLLDDVPLPRGTTGSSVLASERPGPGGPPEGPPEKQDGEVRMGRGFFTLVAADSPGLQVSDAQGFWYLADQQLSPGDILVLPGQALHVITAGALNPALHCINPAPNPASNSGLTPQTVNSGARTQVTFHLNPRPDAQLSAAKLHASGRAVAPAFLQPVIAREFMERAVGTMADRSQGAEASPLPEPTLRYTLSDPLSGAPMIDSLLARCGHSFGAASMLRVAESGSCPLCGKEVNMATLVPNPALRNAASFLETSVAHPPFPRFPIDNPLPPPTGLFWDQLRQRQMVPQRRPVQPAPHPPGFGGLGPNPAAENPLNNPGFGALAPTALTPFKRKLEPQTGDRLYGWPPGFQGLGDPRLVKRRPEGAAASGQPEKPRGVQYPYKVREHVVIKGNKRTPAHVVGKRAIITEQCLNGWYMVRTLDHGETLRLQYRSLERLTNKPDQRPVGAPKNTVDIPGSSLSNPVSIDMQTQAMQSQTSGVHKSTENKAVAIAARSQQLVMMALNRRTSEAPKAQTEKVQMPGNKPPKQTADARPQIKPAAPAPSADQTGGPASKAHVEVDKQKR
ncbi:RING/U-box superfamily protein [Klebsormidium nitens]|uniref:RING/U-box superfamily protein n=1 Tax=Klebsormidium nitens TaxID=105231 RepID=A0A1Y1IUK5_KLENI|nr:RING/U-box superfamily protein [Klebsormidium nitens]|eukprot:GAQ91918.1 RING/U-box superfamily protein [Klebsormidium nitens]